MEKNQLFGTLDALPNDGIYPEGIIKKVVFGPKHFAPEENFVVRCYMFGPGKGPTVTHEHPWCHWAIVQRGEATVNIDGVLQKVPAGSWFHVPGSIPHTVYNQSPTEEMAFLCIVRPEGDTNPPPPTPSEEDKSFC